MTFDWHEVAIGAIGLLFVIGGWVWSQTVRQLNRQGEKLDAHMDDDRREFAAIRSDMGRNQVELLTRISGRWGDRT